MANKTSTFTNNLPPAVDATWYNINQTEMNNLITGSGLTVDNTGAINTQQQQSASRFAANNFYIDSGAADAYVLTLAASFTNPVSATVGYFVGMTIRFRAGNAGTGGAATVNVNQAGVKSLKEGDGTTNPTSIPTTIDTEWRYDGTVFRKVNLVVAATESVAGITLLPKPITIANNATDANNDIDFNAGVFQFSDGSGRAVATTALTKRLDASWVAGTNQGGLFTGAKANSTWYHCFAIYNPTSGLTDCGFDTSVTAANIPSGYTKYKRVGSIRTNGSGNILAFTQIGTRFEFVDSINDIVAASVTVNTPTLRTISSPLGLKTVAFGEAGLFLSSSGAANLSIYSPATTRTASNAGSACASNAVTEGQAPFSVLTNTSSQINTFARYASLTPTMTLYISTFGFIDLTL